MSPVPLFARRGAEQVDAEGSGLHTDAASHYRQLGRELTAHELVDHSEREYVRGDVSINQAENYFSQLKRSIDGTPLRQPRHLHRYLTEFFSLFHSEAE